MPRETPRFQVGDTVETKIVYGRDRTENIWIQAKIDKYNPGDDTYDVTVKNPKSFNVRPKAVHVPSALIKNLYDPTYVDEITVQGYSKSEAFLGLEETGGDVEDALLFLHQLRRKDRKNHSESSTGGITESSRSGRSSNYSASISQTLPDLPPLPEKTLRPSPSQNSYRKTSFAEETTDDSVLTLDPKQDEFDYTVVFAAAPLGFEVHPCMNNRNGCVGKRLNRFSQDHVYKGSLILACNDIWLLGQTTVYIQQCILAETQHPPVTHTFRAKKWMRTKRARLLRRSLESKRAPRRGSNNIIDQWSGSDSCSRSSSLDLLTPHRRKSMPTPRVVVTRKAAPKRSSLPKKSKRHQQLRVYIEGGKTKFGITHLIVEINNKEQSTRTHNPTRTPIFGQSLIWEKFTLRERNCLALLTVKAMCKRQEMGQGVIRVPETVSSVTEHVELTNTEGAVIGNIDMKVTHIM